MCINGRGGSYMAGSGQALFRNDKPRIRAKFCFRRYTPLRHRYPEAFGKVARPEGMLLHGRLSFGMTNLVHFKFFPLIP
jgi:hypothetical protein